MLRNPAQNDAVYQTAQRLFRSNNSLNLTREDKIRFTIRRLAWKRFVLGYPPRKPNDTSLGDPINWEWIIHCAKENNKNVVIVSRDSDYGYRYRNEPIINDWLLQEFRERVSRKKKVILTNRLTHTFELTKVTVKSKEVDDENKLIDALTHAFSASNVWENNLWRYFGRQINEQAASQEVKSSLSKFLENYYLSEAKQERE